MRIYYKNESINLSFETESSLFSPKAIDKGSLNMLKQVQVKEDDKVLDLGCGYGFVGITLKATYPSIKLDMVDNDPVAIKYATKNIEINNLDIRAWQSDIYSKVVDKDYTKILSNPPYHSDFSVAKKIIENGFKHLSLQGQLILVVKRLLWYKNKMSSIFGGVKVMQLDDYYVLISEKRTRSFAKKKKKPIKKKHLRRIKKKRTI